MLYPLIMLVALGCGGWLLRRSQRSLGLPSEQRVAIGLGAFCGAMLGAKLPFLLADLVLRNDWQSLLEGHIWLSGGKTIMCGMVGAYFGVELAKWLLGMRTKTGDSFVVPVAVSVAIGRLGCYVAGCCYGAPSDLPWAVVFPAVDNLCRHPTQLYEFAFHAGLAGCMYSLRQHGIWKGQLAKFYILSYLAFRFTTEWIRPELRLVGGLTGYQWFALTLFPVFAWLWWRERRSWE